MLGLPLLYLKGMRIMMFQLSGFYCNSKPEPFTCPRPAWVRGRYFIDALWESYRRFSRAWRQREESKPIPSADESWVYTSGPKASPCIAHCSKNRRGFSLLPHRPNLGSLYSKSNPEPCTREARNPETQKRLYARAHMPAPQGAHRPPPLQSRV